VDPVSHGVVGAVCAALPASVRREELRTASLVGGIAALLPDLDVLIRSTQDPLLKLEYHRHFTHALAFIPIGAAVAWLFAMLLLRLLRMKPISRSRIYLYSLVGYGTHGFLDAATSYGTQLLWPFSVERIAWSIIGIVDPLFTVTLLVLLVVSTVRRSALLCKAALLFGLCYLSIGFIQRERAEQHATRVAVESGLQLSARGCEAKPSPLTLTLWRSICETTDNRFITGAWYLGPLGAVRHYPGVATPKFSIERDAPWLREGSRQYRDLKRFEWFSSGFITPHPEHEHVIGDLRYSMLPHRVSPLWGIVLDPQDPREERPTPFRSFRTIVDRDYATFFSMVRGKALP
jgi:inner membrane protein